MDDGEDEEDEEDEEEDIDEATAEVLRKVAENSRYVVRLFVFGMAISSCCADVAVDHSSLWWRWNFGNVGM